MAFMVGMAGPIHAQGRFQSAVGDAPISMIDVRDIAAVALRVLTEGEHLGKVYDLSGPESITYFDVARHPSVALGCEIIYVPLHAWRSSPPESAACTTPR